jgi:hypothetical protein
MVISFGDPFVFPTMGHPPTRIVVPAQHAKVICGANSLRIGQLDAPPIAP